MSDIRAIAEKTLDLAHSEDMPLAEYDRVSFYLGWRRLSVSAQGNSIVVNTDLGRAITIEMSSSNQFSISLDAN